MKRALNVYKKSKKLSYLIKRRTYFCCSVTGGPSECSRINVPRWCGSAAGPWKCSNSTGTWEWGRAIWVPLECCSALRVPWECIAVPQRHVSAMGMYQYHGRAKGMWQSHNAMVIFFLNATGVLSGPHNYGKVAMPQCQHWCLTVPVCLGSDYRSVAVPWECHGRLASSWKCHGSWQCYSGKGLSMAVS